MNAHEVIDQHRAAGREFRAAGTGSFVRESGTGDPVVCIHGVPTSSFLYRKVLDELAARELHGVAFDLPGLGLAERPATFDYSWSGLGRFCAGAVDALELDRFHLVVHDIGGPVGFELAAARAERIASLTVLNTMIEVDRFKRPWSMEPFARFGLGEIAVRTLARPAFRLLMKAQGIADTTQVTNAELDAYLELLKREDGGAAFLKIMRSFERTSAKRDIYVATVRRAAYPIQIVWGERDPALKIETQGRELQKATGVETIHRLPAKHFLQEDQAPAIAERVAALVARA